MRERAVELLRELVELESPTSSPGVRVAAERVGKELTELGASVRLLEGDHLVAELDGAGAPLLVVGHTDTVWPLGTLDEMPFRVEGDRAYGPGAYDMKGSLVLMLEAIRHAGYGRRALRIFLTADEEMGSRTGRYPLTEAAEGVAAGLVVEPPAPSGEPKIRRKGLGRFRLRVKGRPAHAGNDPGAGASAIEEVAHQILALHALNDEERGVTVNVGVVGGGTSENVVAAEAEARVDVRVAHRDDLSRLEAALEELEPAVPGTSLSIDGGWTRPPLEPTSASEALFSRAREHGAELGLDLRETPSGGGSDGNLVAALGVPVLDGLGAPGAGAHAPDEHVLLEPFPVRAELLARLLSDRTL